MKLLKWIDTLKSASIFWFPIPFELLHTQILKWNRKRFKTYGIFCRIEFYIRNGLLEQNDIGLNGKLPWHTNDLSNHLESFLLSNIFINGIHRSTHPHVSYAHQYINTKTVYSKFYVFIRQHPNRIPFIVLLSLTMSTTLFLSLFLSFTPHSSCFRFYFHRRSGQIRFKWPGKVFHNDITHRQNF